MELVAENVECRRAGRIVLSGLDFRLAEGQAMALRGPNGVGKSTLLRLLAGLVPLSGGSVLLADAELGARPQAFQERVAYQGHLDAVKPAMGVEENLAAWAGILGAPRPRVEAAMERLGLTRIAERPAGQCSAGQKRRLGLARLLLAERPLWLLDEPTVSLDAEGVALVAEIVSEHCEAGGMALIATHVDLGLGGIPALTLSPPAEEVRQADDPFLSEAWT